MEVLQEIFLTALFSLVFAFLLAKLVSAASVSEKDPRKPTANEAYDEPAVVGGRFSGDSPGGVLLTREGGECIEVEAFERGLAREEKERLKFGEVVYERVRETTEEVEAHECQEFGCEVAAVCGLERVVGEEGVEEVKDEVVGLDSVDGRQTVELSRDVVRDHGSELVSSASNGIDEEKMAEAVEGRRKEGEPLDRLAEELMKTEEGGQKSVTLESVCEEETTEKQPNIARDSDSEPATEVEGDEEGGKMEEEEGSEADGKGGGFSDDEDWEGIERSEVAKLFSVAESFIASPNGNEIFSKLANDVQMQLYGLHKVATEGPCYESSPSALKPAARAKWHAWQKLGSMNPEVAMEQYIALLSESIPGWKAAVSRNDQEIDGCINSPETAAPALTTPDSSSSTGHQTSLEGQRFSFTVLFGC